MPVVSVSEAVDLLNSGRLDGRAVAVAGYFFEGFMMCPAPHRYIGPLEDWCRIVAFTDDEASAHICHSSGNGTGCTITAIGVPTLPPQLMPETIGQIALRHSGDDPQPMVVIGHADDPRAWQCASDQQNECSRAFVADRIAWVEGREVPMAVPETWDQQTEMSLAPVMSLDEVAAAAGVADRMLTAAAFTASDIWAVDPRWNLVGEELVWVVRALLPDTADDPTRGEQEILIDDSSGSILGSRDMQMGEDYQPARLWIEATRSDVSGNTVPPDSDYPFYGIHSPGELDLHSGRVSGTTSGGSGIVTYGPGLPLIVDPGSYTISAWLARLDGGTIGPQTQLCLTSYTFGALDDVTLRAAFKGTGTCKFDNIAN